MKLALIAAYLLVASTAAGQNMFTMNAAYQNQINNAYSAAWGPRLYYGGPYYGGGYYGSPCYGPRYYADPFPELNAQRSIFAAEQQARELRRLRWTIQQMDRNRD